MASSTDKPFAIASFINSNLGESPVIVKSKFILLSDIDCFHYNHRYFDVIFQ